MLSYLLSKPKKSLKCARACAIINGTYLSSKKRNVVLKKAGIIFDGASIIMPPFFFEFGRITLKNNVYINSGCTFLDNANISIGENSLLGPNVTLSTPGHPTDPITRNTEVEARAIFIGSNVWLGAGVVVLPGVTIGDNSVIAANSFVTTDVPANCLYAGAPAVFKREI